MFNRDLKVRIETLEAELAGVKAELAEVRQILPRVLAENHFLRQESDQLRSFGITPAFPVKRHEYPDLSQPESIE